MYLSPGFEIWQLPVGTSLLLLLQWEERVTVSGHEYDSMVEAESWCLGDAGSTEKWKGWMAPMEER